ncbi:hypothetical protein K440DRAFT_678521 [Wilcoxina mikolae CBS 423.85]|nr:hypothetical protein K440DRAFT_678521 [Wilcoxina mikolae CBS 423.85]
MFASFLAAIVSLIATAVIAAPIDESSGPLEARGKPNTCKMFQIFASPFGTTTSRSGYVGNPTCCCINQLCHVIDYQDHIDAGSVLDVYLAGDFNIRDQGGHQAIGSLDSGSTTYTVAGLGACPNGQ